MDGDALLLESLDVVVVEDHLMALGLPPIVPSQRILQLGVVDPLATVTQ